MLLEKSGPLGIAHESHNSQQFSLLHLAASFNGAMCNILITAILNLAVKLTVKDDTISERTKCVQAAFTRRASDEAGNLFVTLELCGSLRSFLSKKMCYSHETILRQVVNI